MKEAPLSRGGFSCFSDTPHREGTGGGVLRGYGYVQPEQCLLVAADSTIG